MKNFFTLLLKFDIKGIFWTPTNDTFLQLVRYLFVGGVATIVDWGSLYGLHTAGINKYIATLCAFIFGLITNYFLSKLFVFQAATSKVTNPLKEFAAYALIGVVGLGLTECLIFLGTDCLHIHLMLVKVFATLVTLAWNFIGRKMLYRS